MIRNNLWGKLLFILLTLFLLVSPVSGDVVNSDSATVTLDITTVPSEPQQPVVSTLFVHADEDVKQLGYIVNGISNAETVPISTSGQDIIVIPSSLPSGTLMIFKFEFTDFSNSMTDTSFNEHFPRHPEPIEIHLYLSLDIPGGGNDDGDGDENGEGNEGGEGSGTETEKPGDESPSNPVVPNTPSKPDTPSNPQNPVVPDTPSKPDTPSNPQNPGVPDTPVEPETPDEPFFPDTPGSDEPYTPILPPAGSVYNFAGFIPLVAGFLLLFLVFFWRRKVYRILKSHAKKHGEKPEKEHLKEIADAIIKLVRDEGRYPEWKKNSDVAKRLSADIVSVLDEMNYARAVPRGALVAEILKAAKGRINRHRL